MLTQAAVEHVAERCASLRTVDSRVLAGVQRCRRGGRRGTAPPLLPTQLTLGPSFLSCPFRWAQERQQTTGESPQSLPETSQDQLSALRSTIHPRGQLQQAMWAGLAGLWLRACQVCPLGTWGLAPMLLTQGPWGQCALSLSALFLGRV